MNPYVNRYGRRGGRGFRPLLLMPKVLSVAAFFGGTVAAAVIAFFPPSSWPQRREWVELLGLLFRGLIVPALIASLLLGAALLWQQGRVLLRMRWLRGKLITLVVAVPTLHWFLSAQLGRLRAAAGAPEVAGAGSAWAAALLLLRVGLLVAVGVVAWLIVLGRHKPRLGQPVRTASQQRGGSSGKGEESAGPGQEGANEARAPKPPEEG
jgi:hypothetical protein